MNRLPALDQIIAIAASKHSNWRRRVQRLHVVVHPSSAFGLLSALVLSWSCRDPVAAPREPGFPQAQVSQIDEIRPQERLFADLAARSPSSAGFFLNEAGKLIVLVRDDRDDGSAVAAVAELRTSRSQDKRVLNADIELQRSQYTFSELNRWRNTVFGSFLGSTQGVISLDLTEQKNRIAIGLDTRWASHLRSTLPSRLDSLGIDTLAVLYRIHRPLSPSRTARRSRGSRLLLDDPQGGLGWPYTWNALAGGIEVSSGTGGCTLGVVADRASVRGVVTASHCSQSEWSLDGGPLYQPSSPRQVGTESADPAGWACGFGGFAECRNSDATFYASSGFASNRGLIVRPKAYGSVETDPVNPYFFIDAVDQHQLVVGQYV